MKKKMCICLVILVLILTILNLVLFKKFYNTRIFNNQKSENTYIVENNI